jgi:hypothetical protein
MDRWSELAAHDRLVVGLRICVGRHAALREVGFLAQVFFVDDPGARLSDSRTIRGAVAAAMIAALGTPAVAADLSPAPPPRHIRPTPAHRAPPRSENAPPSSPEEPSPGRNALSPSANPSPTSPSQPPRSSDMAQDGARSAAGPVAGWGTSRGNVGTSANFPTDPSGVIDGQQFSSKSEFSPNLLTEGELSRSAPQSQFRRY